MRWPSHQAVVAAAIAWAEAAIANDPSILALGYFGSYARHQAGVGSDLDIVIIVTSSQASEEPRGSRIDPRLSLRWDFATIPVPVDALVYTLAAWQALSRHPNRMYTTLTTETVWLVGPVEMKAEGRRMKADY
ncbi:nucleotidyltransferase domain-containing protein [Leptolyngbya sp. PCC 6406]|uniref:nucleotidyltransferase domain-containing protein n=1 Tax=Leptolyngbya sp. PCC 6406 TaxID=1173264 RepID=UPI0006862663|nr:nucleotidyltransferase domain-containing protein [Leptolyngbya sp. PCC 6406]